jgi:hypothetical protein
VAETAAIKKRTRDSIIIAAVARQAKGVALVVVILVVWEIAVDTQFIPKYLLASPSGIALKIMDSPGWLLSGRTRHDPRSARGLRVRCCDRH